MILGIGNDLVDIRRIERLLTRFGPRFVQRIFTQGEQATAARAQNPVAFYAKRFAAKEACAKALGTGMSQGVAFRDIEVVTLPSGQPTLRLHGGALKLLNSLLNNKIQANLHLSLSDEPPMAQAFVIVENRETTM